MTMESWKSALISGQELLSSLLELDAALRRMEDHGDLTSVLGGLMSSTDAEIRKRSSWCMAKMGQNKKGDADVLPFLLQSCRDPEAEVRENCAWGLGEFAGAVVGDERCLQALEALLVDIDRDVRGMSAWALGRLADKMSLSSASSIRALEALLDDPSPYVRKSVEFACQRIKALQG